MKILIIGSEGFIGSHCVNFFSKKNTVYMSDVYNLIKKNYFQQSPFNSNFDKLFKTHNFDICINCSGSANVNESFSNPSKDFELNTLNVSKIIEAIKNTSPFCKFINISSAAVYGDPEKLPIN